MVVTRAMEGSSLYSGSRYVEECWHVNLKEGGQMRKKWKEQEVRDRRERGERWREEKRKGRGKEYMVWTHVQK